MPYEKLDPITQLEQRVHADLKAALAPRGADVEHHGGAATNAPGKAPADITVRWSGNYILVEVTQQLRENEFGAIQAHLERAVVTHPGDDVNLLYASPRTSNRLSMLIRNENQRRSDGGIGGRIIHLRFRDLQAFLAEWHTAPSSAYPLDGLGTAFSAWADYKTDVTGALSFQKHAMPGWTEKALELDQEQMRDITRRQEQLKRDISNLENKLRERGITGERAQKMLVFLFFVAIYEDKRGSKSRVTPDGFRVFRSTITPAQLADPKLGYRNRTLHALMNEHVLHDVTLRDSGMFDQYDSIDLDDGFVEAEVLPIFAKYPLSDAGVDFIGAVFEAMARRAEKDNRIGQFFTPETAVHATCRLVGLRPDDVVLDPACGTGRFLIRGMGMMLAQAEATATKSRKEIEDDIKEHQLLGTEIAPWVAAIAKMNMYLHGDGKSNVKAANGLTLSSKDVFAPRFPAQATEAISVVLMNPPLGDLNFLEVGRDLARRGLLTTKSVDKLSDNDLEKLTVDWSRRFLPAVEHVAKEHVDRDRLEAQIESLDAEREKALLGQDTKNAKGIKRRLDRTREALAAVKERILADDVTWQPRGGSNVKGGALFLSVIHNYLKPVRTPGEVEEWRGGTAGVVIDESLLNTASHGHTRAFIRRHFFVKAIISLPRDAFAFLAKTTAKTSIILLVRKQNTSVEQIEPVFYARAEDIGYTPTGLSEGNDLPAICDAFDVWRASIKASWQGPLPNPAAIAAARDVAESAGYDIMMVDQPKDTRVRMDHAFHRMQRELNAITPGHTLGDYVESVVENPSEVEDGEERSFATASGVDGRVRRKNATVTQYKARDLRQLKSDDILVSGIDLIRGAVGIVPPPCEDLVVSKEYFVFRVREEKKDEVLPSWVASILRSHSMRSIVEGTITGVSNRTRVEKPEVLLALPINSPPSMEHQRKLDRLLRKAYHAQDRAAIDIQSLQDRIATGEA